MEINQIASKNQILRDIFKNSFSKNLTGLLQTRTRSIAVKTAKKIRDTFRIMSNSYDGAPLQKEFVLEYASEDFFF